MRKLGMLENGQKRQRVSGRPRTHAPEGSRTPISQPYVAESDARCEPTAPELANPNQAWSGLPEQIKRKTLELTRSRMEIVLADKAAQFNGYSIVTFSDASMGVDSDNVAGRSTAFFLR